MAEPTPGAGGPDRPQAQPEPHAAGAGGQAAKLKVAYARLPDALRHHPAVLEQRAQRAQDIQLRIADWITGFAGSMNFGQNRQASFQQAKADHDFAEQELELRTNTELTREIDRFTLELHSRVARQARRIAQGTITIGTGAWRARLTATEPTTRCLACDELPTTIATLSPGWASRIRSAAPISTPVMSVSMSWPRSNCQRSSRPRN